MATKTTRTAKKAAKERTGSKKNQPEKYNEFKEFEGRLYTGMKIGRSHKWYYDKGTWRETKITPDLWEVSYAVTKRRAGKAPGGSGVPVDTAYHWYILAHQNVRKLNANDYDTSMSGIKFKLAHRRAKQEKWSAKVRTQNKHLIKFLKEVIVQLEQEPIPVEAEHKGEKYKGQAIPVPRSCREGVCYEFEIILNDEHVGIIRRLKSGWKMDRLEQKLVDAIGNEIVSWYNSESGKQDS